MRTATLDEFIRQEAPALKAALEQLTRDEGCDAVDYLNSQSRVYEIGDRKERISEISLEYVRSPEKMLVVTQDDAPRCELNEAIHRTMLFKDKVTELCKTASMSENDVSQCVEIQ